MIGEETSKERPAASERDLVETIFKDYNKDVRPVKDYHQVLNVTIQPQIYSLIDVVSHYFKTFSMERMYRMN